MPLGLQLRLSLSTAKRLYEIIAATPVVDGGDDVLLTQSGDAIITQNGDFLVKQDEYLVTQSGLFLLTQAGDQLELS